MIKQYRKHYKLTLADMEKLTKVDASYISKIERNEKSYKGKAAYEKIIRVIKNDNKFNVKKASEAYSKTEARKGFLVNFIYKLLGVVK